jgi:hypothetical protein
MLVQCLSPMLAATLLGLLGLRWPRIGGLAYLIVAGSLGYWFLIGSSRTMSVAGLVLTLLMAGGCGVIGLWALPDPSAGRCGRGCR